jgi:hypothetical protein
VAEQWSDAAWDKVFGGADDLERRWSESAEVVAAREAEIRRERSINLAKRDARRETGPRPKSTGRQIAIILAGMVVVAIGAYIGRVTNNDATGVFFVLAGIAGGAWLMAKSDP